MVLSVGVLVNYKNVSDHFPDSGKWLEPTQEHIENNAAVRRILLERGVVPEAGLYFFVRFVWDCYFFGKTKTMGAKVTSTYASVSFLLFGAWPRVT
jgi:hypothetical protein